MKTDAAGRLRLTPRRWPDFVLRLPGLTIRHYRLLRARTPWGPSKVSRREAARATLSIMLAGIRIHGILMSAERRGGQRGIGPWQMRRVRERIRHDLSRVQR